MHVLKRPGALYIGILAMAFTAVVLTGCTKNILYIHGTIQEEMDKMENDIPADPHSLFKIASISKLYIAAAASKLIADERLVLAAKLSEMLHYPGNDAATSQRDKRLVL